jgi:hypothetical protein
VTDWNKGEYYVASFAVARSRRYHAKMCAFYEWSHNLARVAMALTGTASFFVLLANDVGGAQVAKYLTSVVAIAATLDAIFRYERKARRHAKLARQFTALARKLAVWDATAANLKKLQAARLEIEEDEPPVRRLIDLQASNEECRSRGIAEDKLVPLSRLQRTFGYVFTFGMPRLERSQAGQSMAPTAVAPVTTSGTP